METKRVSATPELGNEFEVWLKVSAFNVKDSHIDIIRDSAYNRTIKNNFANIKYLIDHNHSFSGIAGLPKEFDVRPDGLWVKNLFNANETISEQSYQKYIFFAKNGMSIDHSVGYDVVQKVDNPELKKEAAEKFGSMFQIFPQLKERTGRELIELKLHEYSSVFKGSNPEANQFMIKADFDLNEFINLGLTDGSITAQQVDNLKQALLHVEGTQVIDPPKTPQIVESIKIDEFAKVLINTCKI
jgi:hypothetical protein